MVTSAQTKSDGLQLASVLQSNMVVQQKKPFIIWGKAAPGTAISITTTWQQKRQTLSHTDSTWKLQVNVPSATPGDFTKHTLTVSAGPQTITLNNLLIGEVWLCSGQSNMDMSMQPFLPWHNGVNNNEEEIAAANFADIRLFRITKETSTVLRDTLNGTWKSCTPQAVKDFSGVAYYFGRKLFNELNIPIGLVQSAYGGASCQAFMKREALAADTLLKKQYLDPYDKNSNEKTLVLRPMLIYNAMIHPVVNLSIKGFLWYQGESNAGEIKLYPKLNAAMINSWRKEFNQGDLPFYFVQMTPHNWKKNNPAENNYARFREAQQSILQQIRNTGMVCTMDVGEPDNIHPQNKKAVGERLALLVLSNDYGVKQFTVSGPVFKEIKIKNGEVIIHFMKSSVGDALQTSDGEAPRHFFIAGADKKFYPAEAVIKGKTIRVYSKMVAKPFAVRYAFTNYPVTNLQNKEGLPVFPFRTDNWTDEKVIITNEQTVSNQ